MHQKILMVCLGNICRSPLAEGILRHRLDAMGRDDVLVDSAGTSAYHVGEPPDPRSIAVAERHGIDIRGLRARQLTAEDGNQFDWILVMDDQNLASARRMLPEAHHKIHKLLYWYQPAQTPDVPDPYYGGQDGFEQVFQLIDRGCQAFIEQVLNST